MLGPLLIDGDGVALGRRDRVVLAALSLRPGDAVSADRLADALWPDGVPASWNKVVQGCVVRLRRALGASAIETLPQGYCLRLPADDIDAHRFERLFRRGQELATLGEPERAAHVLGEALALWRGRALVELEGWEQGETAAARLEELRLEAEEAHTDAALRAGQYRAVLAEAQARVAEAPFREVRWALLAQAQYQAGRQGDALRTLRRARDVLATELGLDPSTELVALEHAILRQDPLLAPLSRPEPSVTCPYLGLVAYDIVDADGFFGRDEDVAACLRRLAVSGVLTVMGPSGCGKSSFVRAGIGAALRRDGGRVVVITPGAHPMDALTSLPASGPPATLIVDQAEEVVTVCRDPNEQARFIAALVDHARRGSLVIALRADRLGDVSVHTQFARLVERGVHLLGPMGETDLRAAIEGPARQAGLLLEAGLVDLLIREVEGEPGGLPLLSHALRQTWERREERTLTVAGYREAGGIRRAIAQSAEAIYVATPADEQPMLRDLFLRLVIPSEKSEPARVRVPRRLVSSTPAQERLIEELVEARLLTSDEGAVELAHEAVARAWPRFRGWLDDDVEGHRILQHLTVAADSWNAMGRVGSELYRGARLAQALDWRDRAQPELTRTERDYLEASRDSEATQLREAQAQVRHERRTVRRLRALVAGVSALAVFAAAATWVAAEQRDRADEEANIAQARRVGAQALVERRYDRALLLARESVRLWDSPETRGNLVTTIERSPQAIGIIRIGTGLRGLDVAPNRRLIAVADQADDVSFYDAATRSRVGRLADDDTSYATPVFSPDGKQVAVSRFERRCRIGSCKAFGVDVFTVDDLERPDRTYEGLGSPSADLAYSADGRFLAAIAPLPFSGAVDNIAVWQVDQPRRPMIRLSLSEIGENVSLTPSSGPPGSVLLSPDGSQLYASGAGPTVAFDVATGKEVARYDGVGALALSPDGRTLAVAETSTRVGLLDTATGKRRAELIGHDGAITNAAFSPDNRTVATVSNDETAMVWNAATGERLRVLEGHAGSVLGVGFGADGSELYTSGSDGLIMRWDLDRTRGLARDLVTSTSPGLVEGVPLISPNADRVLLLGERASILDASSGARTELAVDASEIAWAAWHPDARRVATVDFSGEVRLWDAATGRLLAARGGRRNNMGAIAYTASGDGIVVADADGSITELDARTLEPTGRTLDVGIASEGVRATIGDIVAVTASPIDPDGGTDVVFADLDTGRVLHRTHIASWRPRANFSPDGRLYAFGGFEGRLGVIDVATGTAVSPNELAHAGPISWVTFSPDSTTLATIGFDGQLTLSDVKAVTPSARVQPGRTNIRSTVAYANDGRTAVVAYEDGSVVSFTTDPDVWLAHACAVAGRNLDRGEWTAAFGARPYRQTCPTA